MRNQRALAAACTTVAVLGLAAPAAVADGMGNGGGPSGTDNNSAVVVPGTGTGNVGALNGTGVGILPGTGIVNGGGRVPGNGNFNGNGRGNEGFGNGRGNEGFGNGRGNEGFGNGRGNEGFGNGRGNEGFGNGRGNEGFGNGRGNEGGHGEGGNFGDHGDDFNSRDIFVTPDVLPAGGRLTVIVNGCRSGTASSDAFGTIPLEPFRDDTARGVATVDRDARRGRYDVTVRCDGRTLTRRGAFTVLGGVNGGLGGSRTTGATPTDMAIGSGLVAVAVIGGGAFWLRRRHEKRA
ncbi:hypothetical protein GT045_27605 [Streptomyces sp. SID486]|uniref:hypothetical protein n=1 Tax=unclassified Streptomyces TaxID=2593676 RepID=UPI001370A843|nr:hypothetical protein [Streptomyces sp. SID486]